MSGNGHRAQNRELRARSLSKTITNIKGEYDVVVVGSGYGGAIAASRAARAGQKVCLLEYGREILPGEFPDTIPEATSEMNIDMAGEMGRQIKINRTGLYHFSIHKDIVVFNGRGLGGTSLINANVSIEASDDVFEVTEDWPKDFLDDMKHFKSKDLYHAKKMLKPKPTPDKFSLQKYDAVKKSGAALAKEGVKNSVYRTEINVNFEKAGLNHVGVFQNPCTLCGDCVSGCNYAAKNTLPMNYLPDAVAYGTEIYCEIEVRSLERTDDGKWKILYRKHNIGQENFIAPDEFIVAKSVFLGAGALGSTEILLRSQSKSNGNLKFSSKLGQRFSGNGDMLGFTYNGDTPMNSVGLGETPAPPQDMIDDKRWKGVGPCISGIVDARETKTLADQMIMEDGTPPGLLRPLYSMVLQTEHLRSGATSDGKFIDKIQELYRKLSGRAVDNTLAWLTMAHDDSNGKMVLDHDRLSIDWEGVGQQPIFQKIKKNLETAAGAHKATPLKNPVWDPMFNDRLVTVHPLGGCPMGDNVEKGAVDHRGRVFNADGTICEGLYVCDGAIVPRSLGVNPLLTIAALAERVMRLYIQEDLKHKKLEVYGFEKYKDVKIEDFPVPKPGIQFTERMAGKLVLGEFRDIPDFCALPDTELKKFEKECFEHKDCFDSKFIVSVISDNLDALCHGDLHEAPFTGVTFANALKPDGPFMIQDAVWRCFMQDPKHPDVRQMWYIMDLVDGSRTPKYHFEGVKCARKDTLLGTDWYWDTTTLFTKIWEIEGNNKKAKLVAMGVLKITLADLMTQIFTTIRIRHVGDPGLRITKTAQFGAFFFGTIGEVYGGIPNLRKTLSIALEGKSGAETPKVPPVDQTRDVPRKIRALVSFKKVDDKFIETRAIPAPVIEYFPAIQKNNETPPKIRVLRYNGGKTPVILIPSVGHSSEVFAMDTNTVSMVEELFSLKFDVYLADMRCSADLPSSFSHDYTLTDLATYDLPVIVDKVLEISGAKTVDIVGHGTGSMVVFISLLSGKLSHSKVRALVASQLATHAHAVPAANKVQFLSDMTKPDEIRKALGATDSKIAKRLAGNASKRDEAERPIMANRIKYLYGNVWNEDQLSVATHTALNELYGRIADEALAHIGVILEKGRLVDADSIDRDWLTTDNVNSRLSEIPILLISSKENHRFSPKSMEDAEALLKSSGIKHVDVKVVDKHGHDDVLFGNDSQHDYYFEIGSFLTHHRKAHKKRRVSTGKNRNGTPGKIRTKTPDKSRPGTPDKLRPGTPDKIRTGTPEKTRNLTPDKQKGSREASPAKEKEKEKPRKSSVGSSVADAMLADVDKKK